VHDEDVRVDKTESAKPLSPPESPIPGSSTVVPESALVSDQKIPDQKPVPNPKTSHPQTKTSEPNTGGSDAQATNPQGSSAKAPSAKVPEARVTAPQSAVPKPEPKPPRAQPQTSAAATSKPPAQKPPEKMPVPPLPTLPNSPHATESSDIPVAVRDSATLPPKHRLPLSWKVVIFGLLGFFLALTAGALVAWKTTQPLEATVPSLVSGEATEVAEPAIANATSAAALPTPQQILDQEGLLNHLPYEAAPLETLVPVVADGSILLRDTAAQRFLEMVAAAERDGVYLLPVSGFRSIEDQEYLFFGITAERGQVPTQRAEVSAPPGYSEHHTGYAIDVLDGDRPDIGLVEEFEQTAAFQWLQANAAYYNFEMSFPRNNPQGVSYEPWHWRFVGDRHSLETFYRASQLQNPDLSDSTTPNLAAPASETP
jgi:D-alanyl-D-alanine carboxypeptidase